MVIFSIENGLASQTDYRKNIFLAIGEGPTDDINGSIGTAEKKLSIKSSKAKTKLCLILHYISDSSYLFLSGKKI